MKFIFAILVLFAFIPSSWAIAPCPNLLASPGTLNQSQQDDCNRTPGCFYDNGACNLCPAGKYCPGDGTQVDCNTTIQALTQNPANNGWSSHQYSGRIAGAQDYNGVIKGARTVYECYQNVQCTKTDGSTNSECRKYYRDDVFFVSCKKDDGSFYTGTNELDGAVITSTTTMYCTTLNNCAYHIENNECFANKLGCKIILPSVTSSGWSRPESVTTYLAAWTDDNGWNIEECYYTSNRSYSNYAPFIGKLTDGTTHIEPNCYARVTIFPPVIHDYQPTSFSDYHDEHNYNFPSNFTFENRTTELQADTEFDRPNVSNGIIKKYECFACEPGTKPIQNQNQYISNITENDGFNQCALTSKGYYSDGCSNLPTYDDDDGYGWAPSYRPCNSNNNTERACPCDDDVEKPCFAGMTTDDEGAISKDQCHYTNETQFCDAYGCFKFDTLQREGNNRTKYNSGTITWYFQNSYR